MTRPDERPAPNCALASFLVQAEAGLHQFWRPAGQIAILRRDLVEMQRWIF